MYYVVLFRSFRACENLLLKGYPLDGYALLRDLKDRCIFLAAIAHNITTYPAIQGVKGLDELTLEDKRKKMLNLRKKEENRVMNNMLRSKSGLTSDLIKELKLWEQIFHDEVHGSKMTYFTEMRAWIEDKSPPSIGPMPRDYQLAMYMNRSCEIGWLIVRLLPYLRLKNNAFGDSWSEKQRILDDSFYHMQKGLSNMGKNIGNAFIEFVNKKFKFNDPFIYCEANGKG
jgi:hypothetical protein